MKDLTDYIKEETGVTAHYYGENGENYWVLPRILDSNIKTSNQYKAFVKDINYMEESAALLKS